jgi:uncharacterized protein
MEYRGIDDGARMALCPVVVTPGHVVEEKAHEEDVHLLQRRRVRRRVWARTMHQGFAGSRSFLRGIVIATVLGWLAAVPLTFRLLFPRASLALGRWASRWLLPEPRTELTRGHLGVDPVCGKRVGFTLDEQIDRVFGLFQAAGLVERFSPLVIILGHGSTSLNNPHESAHDCGACGGRRGGANARIFAAMANDPEVRAGVKKKGIAIPDGTWFVGGLHDTASDAITLYDLDRVPATHRAVLDRMAAALDEARARSAHERCRRFDYVPLGVSFQTALRAVERRATALDEPRPEYGHATNAICVVGRRTLTRGLYFDRRAFLTSYDPTIDPDGDILARILGAVGPVCAGISLEYYFSPASLA